MDDWLPAGVNAPNLTADPERARNANLARMRLASIDALRNVPSLAQQNTDAVRREYQGPNPVALHQLVRNSNEEAQLKALDTQDVPQAAMGGGYPLAALQKGMAQAGTNETQYANAIRTKARAMGVTPQEAGADAMNFMTPDNMVSGPGTQ